MNLVHLHLLLNHVPTVSMLVASGVLFLALAKRSEDLKRASLAMFFAIALLSVPTYMTGYSAQNAIKDRPGVSAALIDNHQRAALLALIFMGATGLVAWFGLWRARKPSAGAAPSVGSRSVDAVLEPVSQPWSGWRTTGPPRPPRRPVSRDKRFSGRGRVGLSGDRTHVEVMKPLVETPGTDRHAAIVLLLSAVTIALLASAANIGGGIAHPEIVAAAAPPAGTLAPDVFKSASIARFQFTRPWAWPLLEVLHFVGLCLLIGIVMVGNLRILGLMRNARFEDVHRLLPWGVWGFGISSVTGMLFFIGQAFQYIDNPAFHFKVVFILLAGANVLYLTVVGEIWRLRPGDRAPLSARLVAASQLVLWLGVIYFGRMLPYLGDAF